MPFLPIHDRFSLPAKTRILNSINRTNHMSLTFEDVVFSPPWFTPSTDSNNTKITVIASGRTAVSGQFEWSYRRDSLHELFGTATIELFIDESVKTTADLLTPILHRYGVNLERSDIVDIPVPELNGEEATISLETSSSSHGWYGSLRVKLRPKGVPLGLSVVNTREPSEMLYSDGKTMAEIYYRWKTLFDVSPYTTLLSGQIKAGSPVDTGFLVNLVKELFDPRFHWTPVETSEFNLYGSTVSYLGPNTGSWSITGTQDDITFAIRLGSHCSNFAGHLLIKLPAASIAYFNSLPNGEDDEEEIPTDPGTDPEENENPGDGGENGSDPSSPEEPEPTDPEDPGEDEEEPSDPVDPEEPSDPEDPEDHEEGNSDGEIDQEDEGTEGSEPTEPTDPTDPGEEQTP